MIRPPRSSRVRLSPFLSLCIVLAVLAGATLPGARSSKAAPQPVAARATTRIFLPLVSTGAPSAAAVPPTDQELIAQALAAGRIDAGTALLYRAYALFRDDRLPAAYWGSGSADEDNALFGAIAERMPTLDPALQTQLRPFVVRPDNAASIFNQPRGAATAANATATDPSCQTGWAGVVSASVPLKVWACKTGDYAGDIAQALQLVSPLYLAEAQLMGQPRADAGGGDEGGSNHIDFYLVEPRQSVARGTDPTIPDRGVAAAIPAPAKIDQAGTHVASGYMLLGRNRLSDPGFRSDVAHELFHVFQFAYNYRLGAADGTPFWWEEATAEWAAAHFVPDTAAAQVHTRFSARFQSMDLSLHAARPTTHPYSAYIWPLFMEQEDGVSGIRRTWDVLRQVAPGDWSAANEIVDTELPYAQNFHQFAIRNLNSSFDGDNPLPKRYQQLDPTFPAERKPTLSDNKILSPINPGAAAYSFPDTLPALRAHYYTYRFADDVRQVTFDFRNLGSAADRKIGAVVKVANRPWQLMETIGDTLHFCFDNPEEDVEEIQLVVSHHNRNPAAELHGALEVRPLSTGCVCDSSMAGRLSAVTEWHGAASLSYDHSASGATSYGQETARVARSHSVAFGVGDQLPMSDGNVRWQGGISAGNAVVNDSITQQDEFSTYTETLAASGVPETGYTHLIRLELNPQLCTYDVWVAVYINAQRTYPGGSGQELAYQEFRLFDVPLVADPQTGRLTGQTAVQATGRSDANAARQSHLRVNSNAMAVLDRIQGEGNFGTATVTWSFTPVALPQ